MSADFIRCESCSKIFPRREEGEVLCPACSNETSSAGLSSRDLLRSAKDLLKDYMAKGEYLTIPELAEKTGVPEADIWELIRKGEIDTVQFDDPHVREYLVNKRREQMKSKVRKLDDDAKGPNKRNPSARASGLHFKRGDD